MIAQSENNQEMFQMKIPKKQKNITHMTLCFMCAQLHMSSVLECPYQKKGSSSTPIHEKGPKQCDWNLKKL
jgi:hypothetical protein